ncbi:hypothetical protein HDU67_003217 [Dinochytrium kinnereticum]|nr:hypothetical protein HDU67_003217 [Dinochytrium kinnereticum]
MLICEDSNLYSFPEIGIYTFPPDYQLYSFYVKKGVENNDSSSKDSLYKCSAAGYIHMTPLFLPWHRAFLRLYENLLRVIDPSISLPYWNWSADSPQPLVNGTDIAAVLGSSTTSLGTRGTATQNYCLRDGFAASWVSHDGGCVTRSYDPKFTVPNQIDVAIAVQRATSFSSFVYDLEYYHNYVHGAIGGSDGMMSWVDYSPNDPIFYLHHNNVDRLWHSWQRYHPAIQSQYTGSYRIPTGVTVTVSPADIMPSFNVPVSTALVIGQSGLCTGFDAIDQTKLTRRNAIDDLNRQMVQGSSGLLPWMNQNIADNLQGALSYARKKIGSGRFGTIRLPAIPPLQEWFIRRNMGMHLFGGENTPDEENAYIEHIRALEIKMDTNRNAFIDLLDAYYENHPEAEYEDAFAYALETLTPVELPATMHAGNNTVSEPILIHRRA